MRRGIVLVALLAAGCVRTVIRTSPTTPRPDALLILPGFGYSGGGEEAFRRLSSTLTRDGFDLYIPSYISRKGLVESRTNLAQFIRERHLEWYARVHVFAFLAGGWTFNPLTETSPLPNLRTVIYDRSPYQERAPRIALEQFKLLTWLKYGSPVFDLARTPYAPLASPGVNVALVIETTPTAFVRKHERQAASYGPYRFDCDAFNQRYDGCLHVPLNHDDLYLRFAEVWPEVRSFIRDGHFSTE